MTISEDELKARMVRSCLADENGHSVVRWNHWGMYLDRPLTLTVVDRLANILRERRDSFDLICPIPTSGFPLAAMLFSAVDVPALASYHWRDQRFHAESILLEFTKKLGRGPRVCTIDSSVQTGLSLFLCDQMIRERLLGEIVLAVSVVDNDMMPRNQIDPIKTQFSKEGKLRVLWRVSELRNSYPAPAG